MVLGTKHANNSVAPSPGLFVSALSRTASTFYCVRLTSGLLGNSDLGTFLKFTGLSLKIILSFLQGGGIALELHMVEMLEKTAVHPNYGFCSVLLFQSGHECERTFARSIYFNTHWIHIIFKFKYLNNIAFLIFYGYNLCIYMRANAFPEV